MFLRSFRYLAALCALLVLAACGTSGTPTPPEPEQATVEEAVEAVDTLVADIVAVASGLMSNDTFAGLMDYECDPYCTWPEDVGMVQTTLPAVSFFLYDYDSDTATYGNPRLATGTLSLNPETSTFEYSPSPDNAFVQTWPITSGEQVEIRLTYGDVQEATLYAAFNPFWWMDPDSRPTVEVPGEINVTIKKGSTVLADFDIVQTLKDTTCGVLAEATTFGLSGVFSAGAQQVQVAGLTFDHSVDGQFALDLDLSLKSGSVTVPIQLQGEVAFESVERDPTYCELVGIGGAPSGSVAFSAGSGAASVGFGTSFAVEYVYDEFDVIIDTNVDLDDTYLEFGGKYVDVEISDDLSSITLGFADEITLPIVEFYELLTIPDMGLPIF